MWFKRDKGPTETPPAAVTPEAAAPVTPTPETATPEAATPEAPAAKKGFWKRAWETLNKPVFEEDEEWAIKTRERMAETRKVLVTQVQRLVMGRGRIDDELLDELETILITADVGVETSDEILEHLRKKAKEEALKPEEIPDTLAKFLEARLGEPAPLTLEPGKLNIIMLVGVNGVGKTTTIGKLAAKLQQAGHPSLVAAADTFRAAAIDQIEVWGERAGVEVIRHQHGGDAAAVVFDAIKAAQSRNKEVLLIDTAGRLHNKANLMEELRKIRRIIDRELPGNEPQVLLVLDATTGQNGLRQAEVFKEATGINGVILTKLDGTAKGGVIFGIKRQLDLPVKMVGLGEKVEDLGDFDPHVFVQALFGKEEHEEPLEASTSAP
ncbi:MAG TPA: signal recognition particle-docking protein FtsY [Oscillatoriaceae cyanobacterium]